MTSGQASPQALPEEDRFVKHLVVAEQLSEGEVHPPGAYDGLVEASVHAARLALERSDQLAVLTRCPACGADRLAAAFEKHRFPYRQCLGCRSLFTLPRPSSALVQWYLTDSPAARFRRDPGYQQRMAERTREEATYRADWLSTVLRQGPADAAVAVVGPRNRSLLEAIEQVRSPGATGALIAVGPLPPLLGDGDEPTEIGPASTATTLEALAPASCTLVTLFNVIEYAADPAALIEQAFRVLQPGGRLALTTRSGSGFDLQVLWERANVFPMDHINLPSVEGMQAMLHAAHFELLELSTPGLLDVQLVQRTWQEQPDLPLPRFLEYFLGRADEQGPERLQAFLQENRLSSHMRVVARKPTRGVPPAA